MKSRTSFFNPGVLKKDILRFSPLWGMYTVFMLLYLFLSFGSSYSAATFASDADSLMQSMGILNFLYAGLAALVLFRDLFVGRLCNALHAMPLRREGWFLTHFAAGMLFCIVPNTLGAILASLYLGTYAYLAWLWLGMMILEFLCFFGIAAFSIQIAGNTLGALATYGIVIFLPGLVSWLLMSFYAPVLYGIRLDTLASRLTQLSPVVRFTASHFVKIEYFWSPNPDLSRTYFMGYIPKDWGFLFAAAGVGLVFLAGSLRLYRKRKLEKAGDFLAVETAKPVFLLLYTLAVSALFYLVGEIFNSSGQYMLLVIGFAVGFFTGWMLLEKRVKVFTGKRFLALGVLVTAFFVTIGITWLDPLGITRYVPEAGKVESVTISPYSSVYSPDYHTRTLTAPADIDAIRDIHRTLLTERKEDRTDTVLQVTYKLNNGATLTREYGVDTKSSAGQALRHYYSHMQTIFGTQDIRSMLLDVDHIEFQPYRPAALPTIIFTDDHSYLGNADPKAVYGEDYQEIFVTGSLADSQAVQGLLEAMEQDCLEGNMAQVWAYHQDAAGHLVFSSSGGNVDMQIFTDCKHTLAYLKSLLPAK